MYFDHFFIFEFFLHMIQTVFFQNSINKCNFDQIIRRYFFFTQNPTPYFFKIKIHLSFRFIHRHANEGPFISWKLIFRKPLSKLSYVYLSLGKLANGKHFRVKEKFNLISRKMFSFYFGRKIFYRSCEKSKNILLFVDYIKFGLQSFY